MSKRILFCADGTWNHPKDPKSVNSCDTNVFKMFTSLVTSSDQLPFYDNGVGCGGTLLQHLLGGAFGAGLFQKIKDGYTYISHAYDAGDEIFLFGFSRGAYTARSLAGMIAVCGLPRNRFDAKFVDLAFDYYRNPAKRSALQGALDAYEMDNAKITMLGVWDTVGSLGVPGDLFAGFRAHDFGFLDLSLHEDVRAAYHALAIDERRCEFPPTLWTSLPKPGQILEQVWFPGVHCDVGGGYEESGLSDITLGWMMQKAKSHGAEFFPEVFARFADIDPKHALDVKHESWNPKWAFPQQRTVEPRRLANTVALRITHDNTYRPMNLHIEAEAPAGYENIEIIPISATQATPVAQETGAAAGADA